MLRYIGRRLLAMLPLLLLISFIVFTLLYLAPYDAVDAIKTPAMSEATVEALRHKHGLDQPFLLQFTYWLKNVVMGDFGRSIMTNQLISQELILRFKNTLWLMVPAYVLAYGLAIALGLIAGNNRGTWLDKVLDTLFSMGLSTPPFWLAMLVIYIFALRLGWLPTLGMYDIGQANFLNLLKHLILPVFVLVVAIFPDVARYVRASVIGQLDQQYVLVQRSLGASRWEILSHHIARNVLLPVVTQIGTSLPALVTGATITETIFQWPGVGSYFLTATRQLDYPVIMAVMLCSAILVVLGNLLADILYAVVDPRIRLGGE